MMSSQDFEELSQDQRRTPMVRVEQHGDDLALRHRWGRFPGSPPEAGIVFLFWMAWTLGCVVVVCNVIRELSLFSILFAVPFVAVWVLLVCVLCGFFFGRSDLRVGPDGLTLTRAVLLSRRERYVPLAEIKGITEFSAPARYDDGKGPRTEVGLMIVTIGKPLRFGQGLARAEIMRLVDLLDNHLHRLTKTYRPAYRSIPPTDVRWNGRFTDAMGAGPPSDSEIDLVQDWDRTVFVRRYPLDLANLGMVTFLSFFWTAIVGVFICELFQHFQWFLFFFLIPFEVVGVVMLLAWLAALTSCWWRHEWVVGTGTITSRFSIFGLGRSRDFDLHQLASVQIRGSGKIKKKLGSPRSSAGMADRPFALGLVNDVGDDFLVFDELTEGEARWMHSELHALLKTCRLKKYSTLAPIPHGGDRFLWDRELDS
jgi:hypothetical protein